VARFSPNLYNQRSLAILRRFRIDPDDAVNGVFLGANRATKNVSGAIHSTLHRNDYYKYVFHKLDKAAPKGAAAVTVALRKIAQQLKTGALPGDLNIPVY
jgi:hypothetical protein